MEKLCASEMRRIQQYSVNVTLDPETAHPYLILYEDGKQVSCGNVEKNLPKNKERLSNHTCVLGKQSFSSGRFYYEVQVGGKTVCAVGVARESIDRKRPINGYWAIGLRNGKYWATADTDDVLLPVREELQKVGVFVDYEEGLVSFYDVETRVHLYSFTGCSFTKKLHPCFCPGLHFGGTNSSPLIISPAVWMELRIWTNLTSYFDEVRFHASRWLKRLIPHSVRSSKLRETNQPSKEMEKLCDSEMRRIQQYAVNVTLDPDTANPYLILSEDGKQVSVGNVRKNLPNNKERFSNDSCVLGKQSFSSGRFYYEVLVGRKNDWTIGVARESIDRKTPIDGFWAIWLRNGKYCAAARPDVVLLPVREGLQKVGVFVDYEEGLVSFYDVETRVHLYCFTGCSFTEKLHPCFCPGHHYGGTNFAPLIISPVNHSDMRADLHLQENV